jgi:phosphoserine phosphatase
MTDFISGLRRLGVDTAIFDLDGTLARTDITSLWFYLRRQTFRPTWGWPVWRFAVLAGYGPPLKLLDQVDRTMVQRHVYRWYHGYSVREIAEAADSYFRLVGRSLLIPTTVKLCEEFRLRGFRVEIHSSNLSPFVDPFAAHLGVAHRAIAVSTAPGGCLVDTSRLASFKTDSLAEIDGSRCVMIADSRSDLAALARARIPIVYGDRYPGWAVRLEPLWLNSSGRMTPLRASGVHPASACGHSPCQFQ